MNTVQETVRYGARVGDVDWLSNCEDFEVDKEERVHNLMKNESKKCGEEIKYEIFKY